MIQVLKGRAAEYLFLLVVMGVASFLLLANLGNSYLWQDEAETALISKTVLNRGLPYGTDGKNSFSQDSGAEYGEYYLWNRHPWLQFYLVAASFKVFGTNTLAARLPFVLFGIGSILLTYFFSKSLLMSTKTAMLATVLLVLSVPFLLLCRQCRYYSPAIFFSLAALYAYIGILRKKRFAFIIFVASMFLLFNTQYLYVVSLLPAILIHTLVCHRERLRMVLLASAVVVVLNLPGIIWFGGMEYEGHHGAFAVLTAGVMVFFKWIIAFTSQILRYVFSPVLVLSAVILCVIALMGRKKNKLSHIDPVTKSGLLLLCGFIASTLLVLALFCDCPFFRYLGPLIPVFCIIGAAILSPIMKFHPIVPPVLITVMVLIGPMRHFLYEITHDYDGPIEGIVKYLKEHANEDDTVVTTYGDLPVKFYTDMRVVGGLTGEDLSAAKEAEWIILRKYGDRTRTESILKHMAGKKYETITIAYPDILWENRPSPMYHHYRTVRNETPVVIHRRIR